MRRCDPVDNPWIDSENSRRLIDALRRGGVSDPGFVAEPGFWIIKSNAIDTLFRLVSDFVPIARSAGLAPDMTACLSYAMQMLCADPESHQIGHHADIWLPVLDANSLTTIKAEGRSPLVQGRVGNQVWVADPCIVGNVREPLSSGSLNTGAFTLIELLTVIATLGILAALILPALSGARGKGKRVQCVNNMRQLAMAQMVYSHDNEQGYFTPQRAPEDQNLNWLRQQVGRGGNLFVCPSTRNQVRDIEGTSKNGETGVVDLFAAAGTAGAGYGHSYWQVGFMVLNGPYSSRVSFPGGEATLPYLRKTTSIVGSHRHFHDAFGLKGSVAGPSRSWMLMDWTMSENIHFPDAGDNHGAGGSNVAMCDGHVEWVEARDFVFKYEMSQDDNRSKIEF